MVGPGGTVTARDFDSQLLESVSVRRRRLRDALLHGAMRTRRSTDEQLGKVFGGVALAAVLCAGCVGWSFVEHRLLHRTTPGTVSSTPSPTTTGSTTTTMTGSKK
ncbi:hypothetical protein ACIGXM_05980 [Kitasatospora sp. NPDC052896]|uniref:hypothetical protein n=1 Tax=Kitasatospora sp. NPDC052896 TaxID=3364061 RepID=UPI0037CC4F77